ncbi:MAG: heme exporter protein CcmB [Bacteroidota bacterium]|jgi:heme exporter protein B|nr:heme exporter protein CcmB [Bacteroidota bacterium]
MIKTLFYKEVLMEFRQKNLLGSIIIYIIGTIFITALSLKGKIDKPTWNALFWIIHLFTSVNISVKNFNSKSNEINLFTYLYYKPTDLIIAKMLYNIVFIIGASLLTFFFYSLFIKNQADNLPLFLIVLITGSAGLASVLTIMSALASKAGGNFALISILSFPLLTPLLIVIIKLSKQAVDGIEWAGVNFNLLYALLALNIINIALNILLFKYLWKD